MRRGLIKYKGFKAEEYKGSKAVFRGRIAVTRGSGLTEFPSPSQIGRIAREEGISAADVRTAFGHMGKLKANGLMANVSVPKHKKVRRGYLSVDQDDWVAQELPQTADPTSLGMPADKRIMLTRGGSWEDGGIMAGLLDVGQAMKAARAQGFTATEVQRAFGHMKPDLAPGAKKSATSSVDYYGPRRMALGHYDENAQKVKGGVAKGSLVLYDKKTGRTPWVAQVIPEDQRQSTTTGEPKLILVRYAGTSYDLTFDQALTGTGLRGGRRDISARARSIPALAFLNAFSFLLPKSDAAALYRAASMSD